MLIVDHVHRYTLIELHNKETIRAAMIYALEMEIRQRQTHIHLTFFSNRFGPYYFSVPFLFGCMYFGSAVHTYNTVMGMMQCIACHRRYE